MSAKGKLTYSMEFADALNSLGVETECVCDRDYCILSEFKVLKYVPFPKLFKLIKDFNPDFTFTDAAYYVAHMAKMMMQQPLLLYLRGEVWKEIGWRRNLYPFLPRRLLFEWKSQIIKRGVKKADIIFAISRWLEKQVKRHLFNYPTGVLYKGIKPELWNPQCASSFNLKHPAVVGVFDLEFPMKIFGLREFIKCARRMPDVHFYFAGGGPYLNSFRVESPRNMFLLGKIPKSKVEEFLATGDVFVHPSGWDALPTTVVEASVMEKPIVASNIGGIPEIVKNNVTGYLCEGNDTEAWVNRIRFLLDNPSVGKRFGKNARKYVAERFDWNRITKDFLTHLNRQLK